MIEKISVLNGYIGLTDKKIVLHYTKNKAKIISVKDITSAKNSIKPLIDLNVLKIENILEMPTDKLPLLFFLIFTYNQTTALLKYKKPYLQNSLTVKRSDKISLYVKSIAVFNILSVILFFIKIVIGKIYESTKRKQNKHRC